MLLALVLSALAASDAPSPASGHDDSTMSVIAPAPSLVADGIPPVPREAAERVGRYTEFRNAFFLDWSPVRREMLILTRFGEAAQVHLVRAPGGDRSQVTFGRDAVRNWDTPHDSASFIPGQDGAFVFMRDSGGNEQTQIFRLDLATAQVTLLTDGESRNTNPVWSPRGDLLAYGSTRRNGRDVDLWVGGPDSAASHRMLLQLQGGGWIAQDFSPDGQKLLLLEAISANESYLWLVDVPNAQKRLLTPRVAGTRVAYSAAQFAADGRTIYAVSDRSGEFAQIVSLNPATSEERPLTRLAWSVDEMRLSHDRRSIAYTANEDGFSRLYVLDTRTGKSRSLSIPDGVLGGLEWHRNGRDLGFALSSARTPQDAFSVDVRTGKLTRWTFSEVGPVDVERFALPERIQWKSFDGRPISGLLYRPPERFTGPRPVLMVIHGGPEGQARPTFLGQYNYFVQELGMALILPNVRGSAGYGKTFLALDNGLKREDSYRDIGALMDHLPQDPKLDGTRVVVTGGSYGGHMALAVATRYPDRITAAISVVGISNLVTFLETTAEYRRDLRRMEYGDERDPQMKAFLEQIAPARNADKIQRPLLIVQGRNDPRVPISEADQIVKTVRARGVPVWYLVANDEGHGFRKRANADYQLFVTARFLETVAAPPEAPPAR
jgi:dipeptidyl aminopeptidase/acylaminoacyl peptidase